MSVTKIRGGGPIVSVIIPTYNRAHLINRAVQSVLNQTYQNFELIIVDDGSTDNTKEVLRELSDKRIKSVYLEENSRTSAVPRNKGIGVSRGDYIAFLDSDDEWLPKKIAKQLGFFKTSKKKNLGFIGCNCWSVDENGRRVLIKSPKYKNYQSFKDGVLAGFPLFGIGSSMLIKKSVIKEIGLFDERIRHGNLKDMIIRVSRKYDFGVPSKSLVNIYSHKNNVTHNLSFKKKERDLNYVFRKHRKYYKNKINSNRLRCVASRHILDDRVKNGRKYFLTSIHIHPFNFRSYFYLFLSFFGSGFYRHLVKLRVWFKQYI